MMIREDMKQWFDWFFMWDLDCVTEYQRRILSVFDMAKALFPQLGPTISQLVT